MPQYFCAQTRRATSTAPSLSLMAVTGWRRIACVNEAGRSSVWVRAGTDDRGARLLFEIDQDHVACLRATRERELFAIAREGEPENPLRSKIGQLFRRRAIHGLRPEVRNAAAREHVNDRAPVSGPG